MPKINISKTSKDLGLNSCLWGQTPNTHTQFKQIGIVVQWLQFVVSF